MDQISTFIKKNKYTVPPLFCVLYLSYPLPFPLPELHNMDKLISDHLHKLWSSGKDRQGMAVKAIGLKA